MARIIVMIKSRSLFSMILTITVGLFLFAALLIWKQERLLFPHANFSNHTSDSPPQGFSRTIKGPLSDSISQYHLHTPDGEWIEVWNMSPLRRGVLDDKLVVFFRGNGGQLDSFLEFQKYFATLGATTVIYNYRSYGSSTGRLSESALIADAELVVRDSMTRESISSEQLIITGFSIGSGIATQAAIKTDPALLILMAPYSSIPEAATDQPLLGYLYRLLVPFLRWELNTAQAITELKSTDIMLVHGMRDTLLPIIGSYRIRDRLLQTRRSANKDELGDIIEIYSEEAHHNDILDFIAERLTEEIQRWSAKRSSTPLSAKVQL